MEFQLTIYGIFGVFWWQLVRSQGHIRNDPSASEEIGFWFFENHKIARLGLLNIQVLWLIIFIFPIYFGYEHSFFKGLLVFVVMNTGAVFTGNLALSLGLPIKQMLTVSSIVCPILGAVLIYSMV